MSTAAAPSPVGKNAAPILEEARNRRTFAIISHPDAGKTTLTEKLLLYGGAIREAGSIKQRKAARHAASDWMAIEQERGISVTSSVLRFEKDGIKYNLLDTPGHKDFSEDTLRTLVAADCALMVIDSAKGVEEQTEKLFEVCRMRGIPVITFVNKYDRPGMDPLEVLSNIESKLGIHPVAAAWPLGYGTDFQGVYDVIGRKLHLYIKASHGAREADTEIFDLEEGVANAQLSESVKEAFMEECELIRDEFHEMDPDEYNTGKATPVFFGSALSNFGLDIFLEHFRNLAPQPQRYTDNTEQLRSLDEPFSGFVFKLQANMNPEHRDCTAFVRVATGKFERGIEVKVDDLSKKIRMTSPHTLMADDRSLLEVAYPGDIVALFNPGEFKIGSTVYKGEKKKYDVIPLFTPEHFIKASSKDPFRRKQLREGLQQLSEEGVVHVFEVPNGVGNELLLGTVGVLQFEVVQHRMLAEYKVEMHYTPVPYHTARWLPENEEIISKLKTAFSTHVTFDLDENPIALFDSAYALSQAIEKVGEENLFKFKR
ncbi:bacterial peptide chain release factor 3 (bRF-3) [Cyclonatronum proteinivorum]|uniref:Peptide chain release factor 3 n=1 Tax=Cyclonatronum proteinivorum TaxID=1457365 RepID=A0A345UGX4_9BACT|nr:peptide chain release factor 3 [Cyclonatronum proteinivorum]AXI99725.1 bacterial peptide chain release factor 3 (bRF-3) [Cyclonatronum proteinivorum]